MHASPTTLDSVRLLHAKRCDGHRRARTPRPTSSGCAARSRSSTRSRRSARRACGSCSTPRTYVARARRADRQPGRAEGARRASRRSTSRGWQVAADANTAGADVPGPEPLPGRQRAAASCGGSTTRCTRADQIEHAEGKRERYWFAPIVADAEAGFGGPLNAFELMKAMIEAGAAGVHFEDQLASREEVRPHGRQGARADAASSSARSSRRASPPT